MTIPYWEYRDDKRFDRNIPIQIKDLSSGKIYEGRTLVIWNASSNNVIPEGVCPAEFSVSSLVERCTDIKEAFPKKISIF